MFIPFLVVATVLSVASADTYKILTFTNSEPPNADNPIANKEVHCFELDGNGQPVYVRGTYGARGYFEGAVNSGWTALVNYQEIQAQPHGLTPTAGAAIITYKDTWDYESGVYWASGAQSDTPAAASWGIVELCNDGLHKCADAPNEWTDEEIALQYCFWDITGNRQFQRENIESKPWWVLGKANPNTWYSLHVGFQEAFGGATVGAYRYTYNKEDCPECTSLVEWGIYSQETIVSGFKNSIGIATEWKATTGPIAGESGSGIYAIVAGPDKKAIQIGFICNSKMNTDPNVHAKKVLTWCNYDSKNEQQPDNAANRKLSQALLKNYARKEYTSWWHHLFLFVQTIWENHISTVGEV